MKNPLRFRQIHLDFHTSEAIPGVGSRFEKSAYQETLLRAKVDSVTTFATCHHGWSYYDTKVGKRHPGLDFDLLRAQFDACREVGINVPIYLTAGVHNLAATEHPEWREVDPEGRYAGWVTNNLTPGFRTMSFHSPYLDYLCEQVREVVTLFPEANGIFLDIISQNEDCSEWAMRHMKSRGLDPLSREDRLQSRMDALTKYHEQVTAAVRFRDPEMPIFHNRGHVTPGFHDLLPFFSHLELESLPTGGWGYDHFPFSAKYARSLGLDFLGMTGKFHSTWGEFGGFKHPNALRYECAAMLAHGAKCSVGDQLHPTGVLDVSTYDIIGAAYEEVAEREAWVTGSTNVADIALLSCESVEGARNFRESRQNHHADTGAARVLLEEHFLFDVIDVGMDFAPYRMLVLPDEIEVDSALESKLVTYLSGGGKLFLTGDSGVRSDKGGTRFDVGGTVGALSEFQPDFALPIEGLRADFVASPHVMYGRSRRLTVTDGEALGSVYDPYFNRTWDHFCSHQHAPARPEPSGFASGVRKGNVLYLAHPVFTIYRSFGQVALRQIIARALRYLLGADERIVLENLPSTGRVSLTKQDSESRYVLHLLNAHTINRGGQTELNGGNLAGSQQSYEVIEELGSLRQVRVRLRNMETTIGVRFVPEGTPVSYRLEDGELTFELEEMGHHQMIEIQAA